MQTANSEAQPQATKLIRVTPDGLRIIANRLEKAWAQKGEQVVISPLPDISFVYYPESKEIFLKD